jgi:co-chaperonin GroES (HSP10)
MKNSSGIIPVGHRLLVQPEEFKEKSEGGIIVAVGNQVEQEKLARLKGTVIAMGNTAYADQPEPWCQVGDFITFGKYSGLIYKGDQTNDGKEYRVINDLDVVAIHMRDE